MFDGQLSIARNRATHGGATQTELDELDEAWSGLTSRERRVLAGANRRQWSGMLTLNRAAAPVVAPVPPVVAVVEPEPVAESILHKLLAEPSTDLTERMPERAGDLIEWIGDNENRAAIASPEEEARDKPRKTVLAHIARVLDVG